MMNIKFMNYDNSIAKLIAFIAKLPNLGQRSATKIAIHLIKNKDTSLKYLSKIVEEIEKNVNTCNICGNVDISNPCTFCQTRSNSGQICIVNDIDDIWAIERSNVYVGMYHVLGIDSSNTIIYNIDSINISRILPRVNNEINEIIMALGSTVYSQTTMFYLSDEIKTHISKNNLSVKITSLAHGIPMGSDIDYIDSSTIGEAIRMRKDI